MFKYLDTMSFEVINFEKLLLIPVIFGVGGALIAIVGANVGAKKYSRAVRMAWKGTFFSVLIVGTIGLFFSIFPHFWSDSFTDIFVIYNFLMQVYNTTIIDFSTI